MVALLEIPDLLTFLVRKYSSMNGLWKQDKNH